MTAEAGGQVGAKATAAKEMTSVRLDAEILAALRKLAEERGESLSDILRRAALLVLGYCPTCQRKVGAADDDRPPKREGK
jgi:Ribbon-helix-helix protein, copG family